MARGCGTLGAASLLGLFTPPRGIVWQRRRSRQQMAAGSTRGAAGVFGEGGSDAAGSAAQATAAKAASATEVDGVAAAAAAEAAAELQQQLYAEEQAAAEEEEAHSSSEEALPAGSGAALLAEQWRRERQADEEELYARQSEEEDAPGAPPATGVTAGPPALLMLWPVPLPLVMSPCPCYTAGYADAVPLEDEADEAAAAGEAAGPRSPSRQQQQQQLAVADSEAEFGGDVYDGLEQQPLEAGGEPEPAERAGGSASAVAAGEPDDLYADLGPAIPQVDGAADSPPRRGRRHSGADPSERWEMGNDGEILPRCVPVPKPCVLLAAVAVPVQSWHPVSALLSLLPRCCRCQRRAQQPAAEEGEEGEEEPGRQKAQGQQVGVFWRGATAGGTLQGAHVDQLVLWTRAGLLLANPSSR